MKTFIIERNYLNDNGIEPAWYFLPDSALCNAGKPFFIPEFAEETEAFVVPVLRISRLGKSIASRFAERYFTEVAPAIHFRAPKLRKQLLDQGLPPDMAQSFDRSLIIGDFYPLSKIISDTPLTLLLNDSPEDEWKQDNLTYSIGDILSRVSAFNTMKMGDYLIPSLSKGVRIKIGDKLEVKSGDDSLLTVLIK